MAIILDLSGGGGFVIKGKGSEQYLMGHEQYLRALVARTEEMECDKLSYKVSSCI